MDDLIRRLEEATEGSAELDARVIAHLVGGDARKSPFNGMWCVYKGTDRKGEPRLWQPASDAETALWQTLGDRCPTRSIDAALLMVSGRLGMLCEARHPDMGGKQWHASVHDGGNHSARAFTPALALVIAALRARQEGK